MGTTKRVLQQKTSHNYPNRSPSTSEASYKSCHLHRNKTLLPPSALHLRVIALWFILKVLLHHLRGILRGTRSWTAMDASHIPTVAERGTMRNLWSLQTETPLRWVMPSLKQRKHRSRVSSSGNHGQSSANIPSCLPTKRTSAFLNLLTF